MGRLFRIHDPIGSYIGYPAMIAHSFPVTSSGTVTLTFDIMFMQQYCAFRAQLCSDAAANTVASWATMLIFEGVDSWAPTGGEGTISYLSFYSTSNPADCVYTQVPDIIYWPGIWYTVKLEANVDAKKWRAFLGYKGQELLPLMDWVDFTWYGASAPGSQATKLGQVQFQTSLKNINEGEGFFYVDNVKVEGPVTPTAYSSVKDVRLASKGSYVQLTDKLVTAGNDQLSNGMVYIQEDNGGPGMRVRYYNSTVREGDRIDVAGLIAQTTDSLAGVLHNGEREIQSESVTVRPSHGPVVKPVFMLNSQVGGGWFGPDESVSGGPEPILKGVWPYNGYGHEASTYAAGNNKLAPLYNVGTLVKVSGVVTRLCAGETPSYPDIYISDGSLPWDGARMEPPQNPDIYVPIPGIRIKISRDLAAQLPTINIGDHLAVTGISGAINNNDTTALYPANGSFRNIRVIRVTKAADIVKVSP
jgi:hypothetical protein